MPRLPEVCWLFFTAEGALIAVGRFAS